MAIPFNRDDREREKFVEAATVANLPAVAVVNPDGSNISGGGGGTTQADVHDGSGNAITSTVVGSKRGLDVNVANTVSATVTPEIVGRLTKDQDSGTGNIAFSINPGTPFKIISVNLAFLAVPTANDFIIGIEDQLDPVYNTQIFKVNPGNLGITNVSWYPDGEVIVPFDQALLITFTNTATTQYGLTVVYETLA